MTTRAFQSVFKMAQVSLLGGLLACPGTTSTLFAQPAADSRSRQPIASEDAGSPAQAPKPSGSDTIPSSPIPKGLPLSASPLSPEEADFIEAINSIADSQRYMIGVKLVSIPKGLHARLGIQETGGVLVDRVVPDTPAAIAGVKDDDILLKLNDKPITQPGDLVRYVHETKAHPVTLTILRDAEPFELQLTPIEMDNKKSVPQSPFALPPEFKITEGQLPSGAQVIGPGFIVSPQQKDNIHVLHEDLEAMKAQLKELCQQVQQLQNQLNHETANPPLPSTSPDPVN